MRKIFVPFLAVLLLSVSVEAGSGQVQPADYGAYLDNMPAAVEYLDEVTEQMRDIAAEFVADMAGDECHYRAVSEVTYADENIISVRWDTEVYMGGVTGDTYQSGYVLNAEGKRLGLNDYWGYRDEDELRAILYEQIILYLDAEGYRDGDMPLYNEAMVEEFLHGELTDFYIDEYGAVFLLVNPYEINLFGHRNLIIPVAV